jgi:hypothetical protein
MAKPQSKPAYNPFAELEHVRDEKHSGSQVPESLITQVLKHSAKSQNPDFVKLTAYVPRELHRAAKVRLVQQGREISELVAELLAHWLQNGEAS